MEIAFGLAGESTNNDGWGAEKSGGIVERLSAGNLSVLSRHSGVDKTDRITTQLLNQSLKKKGGRNSTKRFAVETVQAAINELGHKTGRRVSLRALAEKLGVAASTISRWLNKGHLLPVRNSISWGGFGARANLSKDNRGKKKVTKTVEIEKRLSRQR
jgi:hypothetical protein